MVKITKEDVLRLGAISQIRVQEDEIPALISKLEAVLSYASHLKEVAATAHPESLPKNVNVMRADEIIKTDPELILSQAPVREENYFVVPRILKGSSDL